MNSQTLSYQQLPSCFHDPVEFNLPSDAVFSHLNLPLLQQLGLEDANQLARLVNNKDSLAQAYAGHQFGHFTQLGDGRAALVAEIEIDNRIYDIHCKGIGRTTYSRNGDGKATYTSALKELIYSEALAGLGVATSRCLAIIKTGEKILRQNTEEGAIVVRLAESHLRVGTFEYATAFTSTIQQQALLDYTVKRHYPELNRSENMPLAFLEAVAERQIALIIDWLRVGFIHGVMNTDNMTISGQTLDFGPCAWMNRFDPTTCFSSIDHQHRYAYGQQPSIMLWNLCRLAESLLPLIDEKPKVALKQVKKSLAIIEQKLAAAYQTMLHLKLGLTTITSTSANLVEQLLTLMYEHQLDYNNTFFQLSYPACSLPNVLSKWVTQWQQLITNDPQSLQQAQHIMQKENPVRIARNHLIEQVVNDAAQGGEELFDHFLEDLKQPYTVEPGHMDYGEVPEGHDERYQTFCGT